jgi:xanthine/uracil permease
MTSAPLSSPAQWIPRHRLQRQESLVAALARLTVRVLLAVACALGVTSLIFAAWAVTQTGSRFPPLANVLFFGGLALGWVSIIANTVITVREIPKDQRNPLSMNAALYRRFAQRSSRRVRAILATVWVLGSTLGATGIFTSTPTRLLGGGMLGLYGIIVALFIALLPDPHAGGDRGEASS